MKTAPWSNDLFEKAFTVKIRYLGENDIGALKETPSYRLEIWNEHDKIKDPILHLVHSIEEAFLTLALFFKNGPMLKDVIRNIEMELCTDNTNKETT